MQLHRRDVVDKATQLLDDYGIADLTMRRLARELGVTPGALYWHFADKQELLGAVSDRILEPALPDDADDRWAAHLHGICLGLRDALLSPAAKERGLFRADHVQALLAEPHRLTRLRYNQLWELGMVELWLQGLSL